MKKVWSGIICCALMLLVLALVPVNALAADVPTRAEWLQELVDVFQMSVENEEEYPDNYFSDLSASSSYYKDVLLTVEFGVIDIEAGDPIYPDDPLTREFAAQTLNYCLGFQVGEEGPDSSLYSDYSSVTYKEDVQIAISRGWFSLIGGKFEPQREVTTNEKEAMLDDARTVLVQGENISSDGEAVFADYVIEVPDSAIIYGGSSEDEVVIENWNGTISVGDVFAVWYLGLPMVYTADAVSASDDAIVVTVSDAPDDSIISASVKREAVPLDLEHAVPSQETVTVVMDNGETLTFGPVEVEYEAPQATRSSKAIKLDDNKLKFSRQVTIGNGVGGNLNCSLSNAYLDYTISSRNSYYYFVVYGDMTNSASVTFDVMQMTGNGVATHLPLAHYGIQGCSFDLFMDINVKGQITYSVEGDLTIGFEYSNGYGRIIKSFTKTNSSILAELDLSALLTASADLNLLKQVTAYAQAQVGPVANFKYAHFQEGTPHTCVTEQAYLYAGGYMEVHIKPLRYDYHKDFTLYDLKNSPLRIYHHWEDDIQVDSCTRGLDTGVDYITPYGSRYYTSGQRDATTGGSGGVATPVWSYTVDGDGNATITGFSGSVSALMIPETIDGYPVIAIGDGAFKNKTSLRSVLIPNSVTTIGNTAFSGCSNLRSVMLSRNLISLGYQAFLKCTSLASIEIPASLEKTTTKTAYYGPFNGCSALTDVRFEEGTTKVVNHLFYNCTGLREIDIPNTVTEIGNSAFNRCSNLEKVVMPDTVTSIARNAFYECTTLSNVTLSKSLTSLGYHAFASCTSLASIEIPASLEKTTTDTTYYGPFNGCSALTDVRFEEGTTKVVNHLFYNCTGLREIQIPDTVSEIGNSAFNRCTNLEKVVIPDSVTLIGNKAFYECTNLDNIVIPESITIINESTFYDCTSLASISLPDGITVIDSAAFYGCTYLESIVIPSQVTKINSNTFNGCTALTKVTLPDGLTAIDSSAFNGCTSLHDIAFGKSLKTIGSSAFKGCTALEEIALPEGVSSIGANAFQECTGLTSFTMPDTVTSLGTYAFQKCTSLTDITLSEGLTTIPSYAFANCTSLVEITIPKGVTTINDHAFYQDTKLAKITVPQTVTTVSTDNVVSYPTRTTVYGCAGSYAETWANSKKMTFVDISSAMTGVKLANGSDVLYMVKGATVAPDFAYTPADTTDVVTMTSGNTKVVTVSRNLLTAKTIGEAVITVTSSNGLTYQFTAIVSEKLDLQFESNGVTVVAPAESVESDVQFKADEISPESITVDPSAAPELTIAKAYDIYFEKDGERVQPEDEVTVSIPVPAGVDGTKCKVYYVDEDGTLTDMKAAFSSGYLVFVSDHFSIYAVVEENDAAGHTITLTDYTKGKATITGVEDGGSYSGETPFTVTCDKACAVLCSTDGGQNYTRLTGTGSGNSYSFTVNVDQEMIIAIAIKGDVTLDGELKNQDVTIMKAAYLGKRTVTALRTMVADVNGDGELKNQDVTKTKAAFLGKTTLSWDL